MISAARSFPFTGKPHCAARPWQRSTAGQAMMQRLTAARAATTDNAEREDGYHQAGKRCLDQDTHPASCGSRPRPKSCKRVFPRARPTRSCWLATCSSSVEQKERSSMSSRRSRWTPRSRRTRTTARLRFLYSLPRSTRRVGNARLRDCTRSTAGVTRLVRSWTF